MAWDTHRWPNFSEKELRCKCRCKLFIQNDDALDKLQALRTFLGRPLVINSATRCEKHNAAEGGAPGSLHLTGQAFDLAIGDHDRKVLLEAAGTVGFTGFGFGQNFLHVDTGRKRFWDYGPGSRKAWKGII